MQKYSFVLIGDAHVGKTSWLQRATKNKFDTDVKSTIGIDMQQISATVDGEQTKIMLWDTAGQEKSG